MKQNIHSTSSGKIALSLLFVMGLVLSLSGCATPAIRSASGTDVLAPDEADNLGGSFLESSDIRTIATKMAGSLLQNPELGQVPQPARIAISPIKNSTRQIIDKGLFTKRLRIELNKFAGSRVRFISQDAGQGVRSQIFAAQDEDRWDTMIEEAATAIAMDPIVQKAKDPLRVAVISVRNTNLIDMNADSFTALVRSKIAEKAKGKITFMSRNKDGKAFSELLAEVDLKNLGVILARKDSEIKISGADYFLGGEFIGVGEMAHGVTSESKTSVGRNKDDPRIVEAAHSVDRKKPNVARHLNVMLIDANTGEIPVEKLVSVSRKMKTGLAKANFILTGELSALSKASAGGDRSDYVIMSFQLVDPASNEVVWEDAYETKKVTNRSVLYK